MTKKSRLVDYPDHDIERVGCKVSWYRFKTKVDAMKASKAAKHNAGVLWSMGYDFGYQSPGYVTENEDGTYTVCIP